MMTASVTVTGLSELRNSIQNVTSNLSKELGVVAWQTARDGKGIAAKGIAKELRVAQKVIKSVIIATKKNRDAELTIAKNRRLPLEEFKPKQNKQGVTAKINKRGPAYRVDSGFMGPRPGVQSTKLRGRAFRRKTASRLPIVKLKGPSPWGVFVRQELGLKEKTSEKLRERLQYHMERRLRYLKLKQQGVI